MQKSHFLKRNYCCDIYGKMNTQERIICRLCLKLCVGCKPIEGDLKCALNMILKEIDFAMIKKPMICTHCSATLMKSSQFKTMCLDARNCILPFINKMDDDLKLNLREVYVRLRENAIILSATQDVCGFCMSSVESCSAFDVEGGDILLNNKIERCLPELDFSIIKKPVICASCHNALDSCFCFVTNCSIVEEKIEKYRATQVVDGEGQIELTGLLEFMTRDVITKLEKEDAVKKEIANGVDILQAEQMLVDVKENVKLELELKNESCTDMDAHFMPENMLSNDEGIKIEETFCGEDELKEETVDVKDHINEEIDIKTEECDFNRSENEVLAPLKVNTRCLTADFEEDQSKSCYKEKTNKDYDPSVTMYECEFCSFQAKDRRNLWRHSLKHKDASEVTMHKCASCSYESKNKAHLKNHMLVHKDPSEESMYKCSLCSYQTNLKGSLKRHMLTHKDLSEVTLYKCYFCSFQTKYKKSLDRHLPKHMDPSAVKMYKCDSCSFQTKDRRNLGRHSLKHKDPSEVTMYKCDSCSYESKIKAHFNSHLLVHKDPSEVIMYKCELCSFETKRKYTAETHFLKHKDSSETMYKCDYCLFQTMFKRSLKKHLLKHKDK